MLYDAKAMLSLFKLTLHQLYIKNVQQSTKNKPVRSKFFKSPDFSCSRSNATLDPVTYSFPAASESLRANSQLSAVAQPPRPLIHLFSPVRIQSTKIRCHKEHESLQLEAEINIEEV